MITDAAAQTGASQTANTQQRRSDTDEATAAADFESFLMLLTAQMRNQDPLSPIDSTQFVEQLASFSTVEQQIQTNSLLEDMVAGMTASDLSNASQWVGRVVETSSPSSYFSGEPLYYRIPDGAKGNPLEAVIYNAGGDVVRRIGLEPGQIEFSWDGTVGEGETAPEGEYLVEIDFTDNGQIVETRTPNVLSLVTEARLIDSDAKLILSSGFVVDPDDIRAVHTMPDAPADAGEGEVDGDGDADPDSELLPGDA